MPTAIQAYKPSDMGVLREIRAEIQKDQGGTLNFYHREGGALAVMSNVTVTLRTSNNSAMPTPVEAQAVTQSATTLLCSVTVSAANAATLDQDYFAVWEWDAADGVQHYRRRQEFDVVRYCIYPVVTDQDLMVSIPDMQAYLPARAGVKLQSSWQPQIDKAFTIIQRRLLDNGNRPCLVLDSEELRQVHEKLCLYMICLAILSLTGGDIWSKLAERYLEEYEAEWARLRLSYDASDDGTISSSETAQRALRQPRLARR
jgi:hypothetical protein